MGPIYLVKASDSPIEHHLSYANTLASIRNRRVPHAIRSLQGQTENYLARASPKVRAPRFHALLTQLVAARTPGTLALIRSAIGTSLEDAETGLQQRKDTLSPRTWGLGHLFTVRRPVQLISVSPARRSFSMRSTDRIRARGRCGNPGDGKGNC